MEEIGEMSQLMGVAVNGTKLCFEVSGKSFLQTLKALIKILKFMDDRNEKRKMNKIGEVSIKNLKLKEGDKLVCYEINEADKKEIFKMMKNRGMCYTIMPDNNMEDEKIHIVMGASNSAMFADIVKKINERKVKEGTASPDETVAREVTFQEYMETNGFVNEKGEINYSKVDDVIKDLREKENVPDESEKKIKTDEVTVNGKKMSNEDAVKNCVYNASCNDPNVDKYYMKPEYVVHEDSNTITFEIGSQNLIVNKSLVFENKETSEVAVFVDNNLYETKAIRIIDKDKNKISYAKKEDMQELNMKINEREKKISSLKKTMNNSKVQEKSKIFSKGGKKV